MAYKVNYNHQRAERDRAKQAKKEAKLREKEEARRKAEPGAGSDAVPEGEAQVGETPTGQAQIGEDVPSDSPTHLGRWHAGLRRPHALPLL